MVRSNHRTGKTPSLIAILIATLVIIECDLRTTAAQSTETKSTQSTETATNHAITAFARTLERHVDEEHLVDYRALKADAGDLEIYLRWVGNLPPQEYAAFAENEKLALWINAYNTFTLKLILDHYPIRTTGADGPNNSIRQIPGNWDKIRFLAMGKQMTLNEIEHETLRKEFNQPGIHVALVCAALGCPRLRNEPYTAGKLEQQLADQAKRYFASTYGLRIALKERTVSLSSIYDWFKDDFVKTYGNGSDFSRFPTPVAATLRYVKKHAPKNARDFLASETFTVKYLDYDWTLNEQTNP